MHAVELVSPGSKTHAFRIDGTRDQSIVSQSCVILQTIEPPFLRRFYLWNVQKVNFQSLPPSIVGGWLFLGRMS